MHISQARQADFQSTRCAMSLVLIRHGSKAPFNGRADMSGRYQRIGVRFKPHMRAT
jgi:hypothetical protein